tara:strand:- start:214 stop:522 length:309 start_codon:yes stop_codon:yes gene_type:complete
MKSKYITQSRRGISTLSGPATKVHTATVTVTTTKTIEYTFYSSEGHYGYWEVEARAQGAALEAKPSDWESQGTRMEVSVDTQEIVPNDGSKNIELIPQGAEA